MAFLRRALGAASRRLGRPELLSAFFADARRAEHDAIGISAVLATTLRAQSRYVDVGTNRGQVLAAAVRIAPRGKHIAFEPIPDLAEQVSAAFPQVDCRRLALGASPQVAKFCHFTKLDGWSGLRRNADISDEQGQPEFIDVRVSTLDAELADVAPAVIKIDVEGAELGVLEGGRALLARARPVLIFEHVPRAAEAYGTTPEAIWELLAELGYVVFSVTGAGPYDRAAFAQARGAVNWLAAPSDERG